MRVLVAGGSYGGLAATVHLLDHCSGSKARGKALAAAVAASEQIDEGGDMTSKPPHVLANFEFERVPLEITIVDERDGFCKLLLSLVFSLSLSFYFSFHLFIYLFI